MPPGPRRPPKGPSRLATLTGVPPLVIVSNRGPLSFTHDDAGNLVTRKGGGGLVTALGSAVAGTDATWFAAALSDADRQAASAGVIEAEGFRVRPLVVEPDAYRMYYDVVSNGLLWFLYHGLFDLARRPRIDRRWREAWDAYRDVNRTFAEAVAADAEDGSVVLVHDYHLSLLPAELAQKRPDLRTVYFQHTPFCSPDGMRVLPAAIATELLGGMAAARACGFHASRWAAAFEACTHDVLGRSARTFVSPAAADAAGIRAVAGSAACADALARLDADLGDRQLIVRVDRIELSKNILRGFHAFDALLRTAPEWRGRVVFAACVYPSRQGLAEYLAYRQEAEGLVRRINTEWGTDDWTPIVYDADDDFPRSVAALRRYDVLLVNPIRDGLNLVAKEGPLVNERDGVLALSRESGVWEELGGVALELNPFDVSDTAEVLASALSMGPAERSAHARRVRDAAGARSTSDWLADQLAAAGS
jgi:trehalose 6-phosphate synthase